MKKTNDYTVSNCAESRYTQTPCLACRTPPHHPGLSWSAILEAMSSPHTLLELRVGRNTESQAESAQQIFSALPVLKNGIWDKLMGKDETLSFELLVQAQTIYFLAYAPTRLSEYIQGLLSSSYPEIAITVLENDPLTNFIPNQDSFALSQAPSLACGSLALKNHYYLPLKTYRDFSQTDPIAPLLSTLSKLQPFDTVALQFILANPDEHWKSSHLNPTTPHPQQNLIQKKLDVLTMRSAIRLAVRSTSTDRAQLLLETIAASFQSVTESGGNQLQLKKPLFFQTLWLQKMLTRSTFGASKTLLSIEELATLYHLPTKELSDIPNIAWGKNLLGEPPEHLPIVTRDMPKELKKDINPFAKVLYKNQSVVYGLKRTDRRRHMYVLGKTGTGKSTLLANMAINDLKNNEGLCVIDPHGDLVETLLNYIPSHRINDVIYFNPSDPEQTVKINLFEGNNIVHRELIVSGIVSVFKKLYSYSWGPRLEYILRNTLLTLVTSDEARLSDILDILTNPNFRATIVDKLEDPILKNFWVYEYNVMQEKQRMESISSILNKVGQFVSSPLVRDVVNARRSSFSIEEVMDSGKILLVNLSQGRLGEDNATLLGSMLITKIQLAAMSRVHTTEETRRDFYLYVDEFQNFATDSFVKILSEARKYRLNLTLANQYIAQIPEEVQKAIFGNCGSMASFVLGAEDALVFHREFGEKYSQEDLVSLGRYQIINKLAIDNVISTPFPATTFGLAQSSNQNRDKVIKVSRERYAKKK